MSDPKFDKNKNLLYNLKELGKVQLFGNKKPKKNNSITVKTKTINVAAPTFVSGTMKGEQVKTTGGMFKGDVVRKTTSTSNKVKTTTAKRSQYAPDAKKDLNLLTGGRGRTTSSVDKRAPKTAFNQKNFDTNVSFNTAGGKQNYSIHKSTPKTYDNTPQPSRRTTPEYEPTTGMGGMQAVRTQRTEPKTTPRTEPRRVHHATTMAQSLLKRPTK